MKTLPNAAGPRATHGVAPAVTGGVAPGSFVDSGSAVGASKNSTLAAVGVIGTFAALLALWCSLDHSLPSWDAAGHLLNGLSYRELFRHAKPWDLNWLNQFMTVNCFYPPFTYLIAGATKLVCGTGLWTDALMKVFYLSVMNVSVYLLMVRLTSDKLAALSTVALVNLCPEVTIESHKSMLDFPVMAMTAFGLCVLSWWQAKPDWKRTAGLALGIGCALMTKQVCGAFLALPMAYCFFRALSKREFATAGKLTGAGVFSVLMMLPWFIMATPTIKRVAAEIQVSLGDKQVGEVFFQNVVSYLGFIPLMMTPLLFFAFMAAAGTNRREGHNKLVLLWLAAISGALVLSTLTWQYALSRYYISALILPAAYIGCAISWMWKSKKWSLRAAVVMFASLACLQFAAVNFYPNPLPANSSLDWARSLALRPVSDDTLNNYECPYPDKDWGINWVLSEIKQRTNNAVVWLNVLPSTQQLNVHTFDYYAKQGKYAVLPTTSRSWSAAGDSTTFKEEDALHYQWYLLKTGAQGFKFHDVNSKRNFQQWTEFVTSSGRFTLVGEKLLPDGSSLTLYQQN